MWIHSAAFSVQLGQVVGWYMMLDECIRKSHLHWLLLFLPSFAFGQQRQKFPPKVWFELLKKKSLLICRGEFKAGFGICEPDHCVFPDSREEKRVKPRQRTTRMNGQIVTDGEWEMLCW